VTDDVEGFKTEFLLLVTYPNLDVVECVNCTEEHYRPTREQHSTVCSAFVLSFFDLTVPYCVRHYVTTVIVFSGLVSLGFCTEIEVKTQCFVAGLVLYRTYINSS